jgi:hypothetical protein
MKLMMSNIFLMLLAAFTSCVSKSSPITQQQIPLKELDGYQNNHSSYTVAALIDGDATTEFKQGTRLILPYDVIFDLGDYQPCTVTNFEYYDGNGNDMDTKFILVTPEGAEHLAFTFTGAAYNKVITVQVPNIRAAKLIIRTEKNGGYPKWFKMYGNFTQKPPIAYNRPHKPLKNFLGVNAHWWDFVDNMQGKAATAVVEWKYKAFMDLNLTSLRNYGNAGEYQPVKGQWAFNPVRQGWYEDEFFRRMKADRPEMVKWSVIQGQYDFIKDSWDVPDSSIWMRGTVTEYVSHGGWASMQTNITQAQGSGNYRSWHVYTKTGHSMASTSAGVPTSLPGTPGFAAAGNLNLVPGDTILLMKGQSSNINFYWKDNDRRMEFDTWLPLAETGYVWSARKGRNKNANDYTSWSHGLWYRDSNYSYKGMNVAEVFEAMNEPNAHWAGNYNYTDGKELAVAWSMMYDGHKGKFPNVGVKNADTTMLMSTSGLASDKTDIFWQVYDWSKTNRGYKNGQVDLPFDVMQVHCYSSAGGQYSGSKGGLPPELGMLPQVRNLVAWSNKYANGREVWIGEWGWDINPKSPLNAAAYGQYNAEQTRGNWAIRGILSFAEAGLDRAQWYRLYADYLKDTVKGGNYYADSSDIQFMQMALLRKGDFEQSDVKRTLVGDYFRELSEFGNYVFSERINDHVIKLKDGDKELYALWTVENVEFPDKSKRPSFTENKSSYTFNVPNGYRLVVNQFAKDKIVKQNISSNRYTINFGSAPVLVEVVKK